MRVTSSVTVSTDRQTVWNDLARIQDHIEWMADAVSIEFASERRSGAGTEMLVETRIGPFRTKDAMRIVEWIPPQEIAVSHHGLFTGAGRFILDEVDADTTRVTWQEEIRFPWYFGGPIAAVVAAPVLRSVWNRNLSRFRRRFNAR